MSLNTSSYSSQSATIVAKVISKRLWLGALLTMLSLLTACGVANLAYNNAPMLVNYYVDDWLDLTPEQTDWLKPRVTKLLAWHRTNELPQYRKLLTSASARVMQNGDRATVLRDVEKLYADSRQAADRLIVQAMPDIVSFMQQVEPAQLQVLEKKFAKDNDKLIKNLRVPEARRVEQRNERYVERFEGWMGSLDSEQRAMISERLSSLPFTEELRFADRKRWQKEFLALTATKPDSEKLRMELNILLRTPEARRDTNYQSTWARQQQIIIELTADLLMSASPAQKQTIAKKLAGYSSDITSLLKV
jgi:Family of unknown function (DUF6279)